MHAIFCDIDALRKGCEHVRCLFANICKGFNCFDLDATRKGCKHSMSLFAVLDKGLKHFPWMLMLSARVVIEHARRLVDDMCKRFEGCVPQL